MPSELNCQICSTPLKLDCWLVGKARIFRCYQCQHRQIQHQHADSQPGSKVDYKEYFDQFAQDQALEALSKTRKRQANDIKSALIKIGEKGSLLDMGTGLGIFPTLLKEAGWQKVAGADASPQLVEALNRKGIPAAFVHPTLSASDKQMLETRFAPEVLSFLDVIEHFQDLSIVRRFFSTMQGLKVLVIKVPVSEGLLFRIARIIAIFTKRGPLSQLLQVGTFPPHYHYFSRVSLEKYLEDSGFEVVDKISDYDFEARDMLCRIRGLNWLGGRLSRFIGEVLSFFIRATHTFDTLTIIARSKKMQAVPD
jgi:SAM-dependent methyltransferase